MFCRNCGNVLTENEVVCRNCGFAVGTGSSYCEACGSEAPIYAIICEVCGGKLAREPIEESSTQQSPYQYAQQPNASQQTAFAQQPAQQQSAAFSQRPESSYPAQEYTTAAPMPQSVPKGTSSRSKSTAAILGFVLGALGVHDFYLGNKVKGLIHLGLTISGGLSFISWIWAIGDTIHMLNNPNATDADGQLLK